MTLARKRTLLDDGVTVTPTTFTVSRIPDTTPDHGPWSVEVVAAGHGRWAVRNMSRCLNKKGEWEYEPRPSEREDDWLETVRWTDVNEAITAALRAEPHVRWNGLTPADVASASGRSDDRG